VVYGRVHQQAHDGKLYVVNYGAKAMTPAQQA